MSLSSFGNVEAVRLARLQGLWFPQLRVGFGHSQIFACMRFLGEPQTYWCPFATKVVRETRLLCNVLWSSFGSYNFAVVNYGSWNILRTSTVHLVVYWSFSVAIKAELCLCRIGRVDGSLLHEGLIAGKLHVLFKRRNTSLFIRADVVTRGEQTRRLLYFW